jgi:RNA polymerase sigma-B factor
LLQTIATAPRSTPAGGRRITGARSAPAAADGPADLHLLRRFAATRDPGLRTQLVHRYLPLARYAANHYARRSEPFDDLVQVASLGLLKAIDRFEPERGLAFASFAVPTIAGEIKRHFRDTRWAVHVPRDLQERAQRVEREIERLTAALRRTPTPGEVASAMGITVDAVLEARDAFSGFEASSLDAPVGDGDSDTAADLIGAADDGYELVEQLSAIAPALRQLTERERLALRMRFDEDMTQAEIGERLGVSQMQISRILRRSLNTLREAAAPSA